MGNIGVTEILLVLVVLGLPIAGIALFLLLMLDRRTGPARRGRQR